MVTARHIADTGEVDGQVERHKRRAADRDRAIARVSRPLTALTLPLINSSSRRSMTASQAASISACSDSLTCCIASAAISRSSGSRALPASMTSAKFEAMRSVYDGSFFDQGLDGADRNPRTLTPLRCCASRRLMQRSRELQGVCAQVQPSGGWMTALLSGAVKVGAPDPHPSARCARAPLDVQAPSSEPAE